VGVDINIHSAKIDRIYRLVMGVRSCTTMARSCASFTVNICTRDDRYIKLSKEEQRGVIMPIYALIIWTVVAATPYSDRYDWRPIASFTGEAMCQRAAAQLSIPKERYQCIKLEADSIQKR